MAGSGRQLTVLITGATTGIGLEFARQYAERGCRVIATHRAGQPSPPLRALALEMTAVRVCRMDVSEPSSVADAARSLAGEPIDILINNAGISGNPDRDFAPQNFGTYDWDLFDRVYATNVKGPLLVSQSLIDNIRLGGERKIVSLSSQLGSLTDPFLTRDNNQSTFYAGSKAALNRQVQVLARALRREEITVLAMHPGAVRTERFDNYARTTNRPPGATSMITTQASVAGMIATIDRAGLAQSGRFFRYDGHEMGW